jgi:hypothetical protein
MESSPNIANKMMEEQQTFVEYQKVLRHEEEKWRLKSRSLWLSSRGPKHKFFHCQAKAKTWKNRITEIKAKDGTYIKGHNQINITTKEHFEKLYQEDGYGDIEAQENLLQNIPQIINQEDNEKLIMLVTEANILGVLQQMNPDKAPGSDGFTVHFYLLCWHMIKKDLVCMIQYVQKSARMGGSTNSSFLALIPKEFNPSSFKRFCPISLCNVSYKIISKYHCGENQALATQINLPKSRWICGKSSNYR